MPRKNLSCGIYSIETPAGSTYIGSSTRIENRFNEHKNMLKRGKHHSSRLQAAFDKYGSLLEYTIICLCDKSELVDREQFYINEFSARLNMASDVNNVWTNPATRKKLEQALNTEEYKAQRSIIAKNISTRWRPVECSNGIVYKNPTDAGAAFGVRASHVLTMIRSGQRGSVLTERFKFAGTEWQKELSRGEQLKKSRLQNGTNKNSDESRARMCESRKDWKPTRKAVEASVLASSIAVTGISMKTSVVVMYPSAMAAARAHGKGTVRAASSQINRCIRGGRKSALGYTWSYGVSPKESV